MRHVTALALVALAVSACALPGGLPGRGSVSPTDVQALRMSESTRSEVLMTLGAPDRRVGEDRFFGYLWYESLVTVLVPAGYQVGGFTLWSRRMLLVEFGPGGEVLRAGVVGGVNEREMDDRAKAWMAGADKGAR
jgi:hypothetical protein